MAYEEKVFIDGKMIHIQIFDGIGCPEDIELKPYKIGDNYTFGRAGYDYYVHEDSILNVKYREL